MQGRGFFLTCPEVAAASAALVFYGLDTKDPRPGGGAILLFSVVLISGTLGAREALASLGRRFSGSGDPEVRLGDGYLVRWVSAIALGLLLGVTALCVPKPPSCSFGFNPSSVRAVTGIAVGDGRRLRSGYSSVYLDLRRAEGPRGLQTGASGRLMVIFVGALPATGTLLRAQGKLASEELRFPGQRSPMQASFFASSLSPLKDARPLHSFRVRCRETLLSCFSPYPWGGLASALLLGVRDDLDEVLAARFRTAGCAHVIALSGMHLAILSGLFTLLLRRPLGFRGSQMAGCVLTILYLCLVGAQPSLTRAALMYCVSSFLLCAGKRRDALNILALAFCVHLLSDCHGARSLSFIFSYLALAGILLCTPPVESLLRRWIPALLRSSLSASVGAFLATAAVQAASFGFLRPVGIISSLILAPAASLVMVGGMLHLVFFTLATLLMAHPLGGLLSFTLSAIDGAMDGLYGVISAVASLSAEVPGFRISSHWIVFASSLATFGLLVYLQQKREPAIKLFSP